MIEITERINKLAIDITNELTSPMKVYIGDTPSLNLEDKHLLGEVSVGRNTFEIQPSKSRQYYVFDDAKGNRILMADRYIDLDGTHNLRDYGGYMTKDGKQVKWGMLFRSDQLSDLSEADIQFLQKMHLKTIVDFRSDLEAKNFPNKQIPNTKVYSLDPNATTAQLAAGSFDVQEKKNMSTIDLLKTNQFDPRIYGDPQENMLKEYRKFSVSDEATSAYRTYINLFLDKDNLPLLQHCRGGKDRTGFGVAILLLILGVSREDIVYDYELSTKYKAARNERQMNRYREYTQDPKVLDLLNTMQLSKGEYMGAALDQIKSIYGSYDTYFKEVLKLNNHDLTVIRNELTY